MIRILVVAAALAATAAAPLSARQQGAAPDGEQVFNMVCAMCHSVNPPATLAPPISHAAAYYVRKYPDTNAAIDAMVAFLKAPAADRSAMPAHAVERFGLMPPQAHLSDAMLSAAARYVLQLADTAHVRHPPHR